MNSKRGRKKIEELIDSIKKLRDNCNNIEFGGDDITKILIKKSGITGHEISDILFTEYNIEDEITNDKSTMLLTGVGTSVKKIRALENALKRI